MHATLRCRCGAVRGDVDLDRAYARGTCYCRDCRAYARWLGRMDILDAAGGTDVVPMAPAGVRITDGAEHVACMALSPRGPLRWYAACCNTPLGNTARDARMAYAGMVTDCLDTAAPGFDAAVGPRGRLVLNTGSATAPVRATPGAFAMAGLRIMRGVLPAFLRPPPATPFFDDRGRARQVPVELDSTQRAAISANPH